MLSIVQARIGNPAIGNLGDMNSTEFFGSLVSTLISLMLVLGGILLLIMILKGGIEWMMAEGDKMRVENARKTITNAIIGIVILFSFYAIINLIGCIFGINFFEIQVGEFNASFGSNPFCGSTSSSTTPTPGLPCFAEGTKISMADGSYKNIEEIVVGDLVYSYDLSQKKLVSNEITQTFVHSTQGYYLINNSLKVTGNHKIYSESENDWIRADALERGDTLMGKNNKTIKVDDIKFINESLKVFNFEVGSPHNYFADDVLVHNKV